MHAIFIGLSIYFLSLRSIKFEKNKMHSADELYFLWKFEIHEYVNKINKKYNLYRLSSNFMFMYHYFYTKFFFFLHEKFFIFYVIFRILRNLYFSVQFSTKTGFCYCSFCSKYIVLKILAQIMSQAFMKKDTSLKKLCKLIYIYMKIFMVNFTYRWCFLNTTSYFCCSFQSWYYIAIHFIVFFLSEM